MRHLSALLKPDDTTQTAVVKQDGVFVLWKLQSEAIEILTRGAQSKCVTENQFQNWMQEINTARQTLQDHFLLATSLRQVQEYVSSAITKFKTTLEHYTESVIRLEHSIEPKERVQNINESFKAQFTELYNSSKIEKDTMLYLEKQVEIFSKSLKKNFEDKTMRQDIKTKLLHELIDDYHREICQIYREAISTRKRI